MGDRTLVLMRRVGCSVGKAKNQMPAVEYPDLIAGWHPFHSGWATWPNHTEELKQWLSVGDFSLLEGYDLNYFLASALRKEQARAKESG